MITHPEKVLFPEHGITKGELCAYYESSAPWMLPHLAGRPVTLERYPAGIAGKGFIQKDVTKGLPDWLERVAVPRRAGKSAEPVHYPLVSDVRGLLWLANQNTITPHVWCSRVPELDRPDWCVFDLDPPGDDPEALLAATLAVKGALGELGLTSFVKTSGSKGFHVIVSLDETSTYSESWRFAQGVGRWLVRQHPQLLTQEFIKADRKGRILVDTGRNVRGATLVAAYAVRARVGAPVSAPCRWDEVQQGIGPQTFKLRDMAARLATVGDPWADLRAAATSLGAALERLENKLTPEDWEEATAATARRPKSRQSRAKG